MHVIFPISIPQYVRNFRPVYEGLLLGICGRREKYVRRGWCPSTTPGGLDITSAQLAHDDDKDQRPASRRRRGRSSPALPSALRRRRRSAQPTNYPACQLDVMSATRPTVSADRPTLNYSLSERRASNLEQTSCWWA